MGLVDLPDEILIIIIKQLDFRSLNNVYCACQRIRKIISDYGAIKTCNLSLSVMAKAETLKQPIFIDISRNLQELNMCGVCNLSKSKVICACKRMLCLNTLDVTYTNITIYDLVEIYKVCPTIKNISINLSFGKGKTTVTEATLEQCQDVFKNLLNVHFVGSLRNMMYSALANMVLRKAKLNKLQYTITEITDPNYVSSVTGTSYTLNYNTFVTYFFNTRMTRIVAPNLPHHNECDEYGYMSHLASYEMFKFCDFETIIIINLTCLSKPMCYVSPMFENFFTDYCNKNHNLFELHIIHDFRIQLHGNVCVMMWNKITTKFDSKFYLNLANKIKPFFPYYFTPSTTPVAPQYDSYVTCPFSEQLPVSLRENTEVVFKKRRVGATNCVLNYDSSFQEKTDLKLSLLFIDVKTPVALTTSCDYLTKLTYLCLTGSVQYSSEFFNVLFRRCNKLITLIIEAPCGVTFCSAMSRSLPLSQSVKNMQLLDKRIDFETLFSAMSQCKTLEIIHISEISSDITRINDPTVMFNKCDNLYCFYLYCFVTDTIKRKLLHTLKQANSRCRKNINIKVFNSRYLVCDPYSDVFNLNLLKW